MVSPLEMYSKYGLANRICSANGANWSENGQWPTAISSSVWGSFVETATTGTLYNTLHLCSLALNISLVGYSEGGVESKYNC